MMIIMRPGASQEQIDAVITEIEKQKLSSHPIFGVEQTIIGAVGDGHYVATEIFEALPGVMEVQRISKPYKLASRQFHEQDSVFPLDGFTIGLITLSPSYATGGDSLDLASEVGLKQVVGMLQGGMSTGVADDDNDIIYNLATGGAWGYCFAIGGTVSAPKVVVYTSALTEVANATDLSGVSVPVWLFGH